MGLRSGTFSVMYTLPCTKTLGSNTTSLSLFPFLPPSLFSPCLSISLCSNNIDKKEKRTGLRDSVGLLTYVGKVVLRHQTLWRDGIIVLPKTFMPEAPGFQVQSPEAPQARSEQCSGLSLSLSLCLSFTELE